MNGKRDGARGFRLMWAVFLGVTFYGNNAWAYVDPGSGFMLWQLLISVLVGAVFYFRKAIRSVIGLRKKKDDK